MADRSEPEKKKPKGKSPVEMTADELMDELFDPKVRKELKKLAHEHRADDQPED